MNLPFLAQTMVPENPFGSARSAFSWLTNHSLATYALIFIIVALLGLILATIIRSRNRPLEVFGNATGRVSVSRAALADLIESAAVQFGAASRPKVDFVRRGGQVHLYIRIKLSTGQRLPVFSSGLQSHIADTLRDALGLENLGGIHLTVTGFKGSPLPADTELKSLGAPTSTPKAPAFPRSDSDFFST